MKRPFTVRTIVVLDNLPNHESQAVRLAIRDAGARGSGGPIGLVAGKPGDDPRIQK